MKKRWLILPIIVLLAIVSGIFFIKKDQAKPIIISKSQLVKKNIPTFFMHGWGSSYRAEQKMANYAVKSGASTKIIRLDVYPSGRVVWHGKLSRKDRNPIFEINSKSNREMMPNPVTAAVKAVMRKMNFESINLVGHSMGNMQNAYYLLDRKKNAPILNKLVAIAGHYNGIVGYDQQTGKVKLDKNGYPNKVSASFKSVEALHKTFPKTARVLNIYGDIGNGTDQRVSNVSSRTLKYLTTRAKSYREVRITKGAQHSELHENANVAKIITKFLWQK